MADYSNLPDGIYYDEWRKCFIEFLVDYQTLNKDNRTYAFEQLFEISNREAYQKLDKDVLDALSDFVLCNIDCEDYEIMDLVTSIVGMLGLKDVWDYIKSKKKYINNAKVVKLIEECDEEFGEHVDDPFWDYRNLN